jgi:hypothetical protein
MGDRYAGSESGQRAAKRARRVTLDDEQVWAVSQQRQQRPRDRTHMRVRVFLAGAAERQARKRLEAELAWIEPRMLAGEDQCRCQALRGKRAGNRLELDRFGPGPDDQPDVRETQPSP